MTAVTATTPADMSRCPLAVWTPSPNFNRGRPAPWDLIVIHIADGTAFATTTLDHLRNPHPASGGPVSAHFLTARDGAKYQLVDTDDVAWHAAGVNKRSLGIEHSARAPGEFDRKGWATWSPTYRAKFLDPADPDLAAKCALTSDPGLWPTDVQYSSSAELVAWCCLDRGLVPSRELIRGHCEATDTGHKDCPNAVWDWTRYMNLVGQAYAMRLQGSA